MIEEKMFQQPVFPNLHGGSKAYDGMLLLDLFAIAALHALIERKETESLSEKAYGIAREMIDERSKHFTPQNDFYSNF